MLTRHLLQPTYAPRPTNERRHRSQSYIILKNDDFPIPRYGFDRAAHAKRPSNFFKKNLASPQTLLQPLQGLKAFILRRMRAQKRSRRALESSAGNATGACPAQSWVDDIIHLFRFDLRPAHCRADRDPLPRSPNFHLAARHCRGASYGSSFGPATRWLRRTPEQAVVRSVKSRLRCGSLVGSRRARV